MPNTALYSDIFHSRSAFQGGAMLASVGSVSPSSAAADIRAGAKVFDVRSGPQHAADGLLGSVSLPLAEIESGATPSGVAANEVFYLVCGVGGFSELAAAYLTAVGFTGARSVRGGLAALREQLTA